MGVAKKKQKVVTFLQFFEYLKDGRLIKGVFRSDLEDRLKLSGEDIENINNLM